MCNDIYSLCAYNNLLNLFFSEVLGETKGKKIGTLLCRGLKPPVIRGYAAAFNYWFCAFGHSEAIVTAEDGSQRVVPKGNPMSSPGDPITLPKRIEVKIPWSKAHIKAKGVTLTLWSNPFNKQLCPVTGLIAWLLVADIGGGYLFPRVGKNNRAVL